MTLYRFLMFISAAGASLYLLEIGCTLMQFIYINAFIISIAVFAYLDGYNADE